MHTVDMNYIMQAFFSIMQIWNNSLEWEIYRKPG